MASTPAIELPIDPRYPIGAPDRNPTYEQLPAHIEAIRALPGLFSKQIEGLDREQLETPYREDGWTLQQLTHHLADSHMNAFIRLKLAVTEDWPTIKPYDQAAWAETPEMEFPAAFSLALLVPLHARMAALLDGLTPEQWERGYVHPESGRATMAQVAALYSWHGRHHTAHAAELRKRMGW